MLATNQLAVMDLLAKTAIKHGWYAKVFCASSRGKQELRFERVQGLLTDVIHVDVLDDGLVYADLIAQHFNGSLLHSTYRVARVLSWLRDPLQPRNA